MDNPDILKFTWKAFAFAVGNFLALVGLLYIFLHKPLLRILDKRKREIEQAHREAEEEAEKARRKQEEYEREMANIEEERDRLLTEARNKAQETREEILEEARQEAQREVQNMKRDWERRRRDALEELQDNIVDTALSLARRVLEKLVDEDVERRLNRQLFEELEHLARQEEAVSPPEIEGSRGPVRVVSARELDKDTRAGLEERIEALANGEVEVEYDVDGDLVAGSRVEFSARAIDGSLADVLTATRERFEELAPRPMEEEE
ncbi:MAG: F0F1 ATP synthase subunit B [Candidatus Brocadiia bacterium]